MGSEYLVSGVLEPESCRAAAASTSFESFFKELREGRSDDEPVSRVNMMMHFFEDILATSERLAHWLRPSGRVGFVIGNKKIGSRVIPTDAIVTEIMEANGLRLDRVLKHKLKTNNSNSQVPWQERIIQDEYVLILTKR